MVLKEIFGEEAEVSTSSAPLVRQAIQSIFAVVVLFLVYLLFICLCVCLFYSLSADMQNSPSLELVSFLLPTFSLIEM